MDLFLVRPDYAAPEFSRPMLDLHDRQDDPSVAVLEAVAVDPDTGLLTDKSRFWLAQAPFIFKRRVDAPLHVAGAHGTAPEELLAVSKAMRDSLIALDADSFEFVELENATFRWENEDPEAPPAPDASPMFLAHPRVEADALVLSAVKLRELKGARPGFRSAQFRTSARVFDPARVPPRAYFIDKRTGYGVCTPAFRKMAEALGCPGWTFMPCTFSTK